MSKIIEKGEKVYECETCGCKFIIEHADIMYHYGTYDFGDLLLGDTTSRDYKYVQCPQCGVRIKVGGRGSVNQ